MSRVSSASVPHSVSVRDALIDKLHRDRTYESGNKYSDQQLNTMRMYRAVRVSNWIEAHREQLILDWRGSGPCRANSVGGGCSITRRWLPCEDLRSVAETTG